PIVGVTTLDRTTLLSSCGPRRIVTKAAPLARAKRARRGHVLRRPDLVACLPNGDLRTEALAAQVLLAHHDRTPNPGGASQYMRLNLVGPQRPTDRSRNVGCRNAGVHGKAWPTIADDHSAIDQYGLTEKGRILTFRHDH